MDYFLIALGNPGDKYSKTRHNVGWIILDKLYSGDWEYNKYAKVVLSQTEVEGKNFLLVKPMTHMNNSGEVISFLQKEYNLKPEQTIVVHDDLDIPFGKIKISFDRGDGGHNGLKSIMSYLGSKEFIRIRTGVSLESEDGTFIKPNVLENFTEEEFTTIEKDIVKMVKKAINTIAKDGLEKATNLTN